MRNVIPRDPIDKAWILTLLGLYEKKGEPKLPTLE
jgi:hypothetical protein